MPNLEVHSRNADDLVVFQWPRRAQLEWVRAAGNPVFGGGEDWWLVMSAEGAPPSQYHPLKDERGLFLEFAETETEREAIADFARRHGFLLNPMGRPAGIVPEEPLPQVERSGEPLTEWKGAIEEMRKAVELLDGRPHALSKLIRLTPHSAVYERRSAGEQISHEQEVILRKDDPAWKYIHAATSNEQRLRRASLFLLQRRTNAKLAAHVAPTVLYDSRRDLLASHLQPKNLLGAMWLQLADTITTEGKRFVRCRGCNQRFELSLEAKRADARYCSNACRMRALRRRKAEALRRAREGEAVEAIAEEVGSSVRAVRRWIEREGGNNG